MSRACGTGSDSINIVAVMVANVDKDIVTCRVLARGCRHESSGESLLLLGVCSARLSFQYVSWGSGLSMSWRIETCLRL
jgi:hypothetical protein